MKNYLPFLLFLWAIQPVFAQKTSKKRPNIVFILADDLGWADLTCYGSTFYETPNLDKLAQQGVRFTNGYAACPVCSPTRASLMTGKYPIKTDVTDWIKGRQAEGGAKPYEKLISQPFQYFLPLEEETIAEVALKNQYKTFFAGKWHLGDDEKYFPEAQGFQTNLGGTGLGAPKSYKNDSTGGFFTPYNNIRLKDGPKGEYLTDRLATECLNFLDKNQNEPFFLMYSLYAVHNPLQAPANLIKKYQAKQKALAIPDSVRFRKDEAWMKPEKGWRQRTVQDHAVYAAMIENMDENVGRILQKLSDLGLDENTIVVFTSDNGGLSTAEGSPTVNGALRAGKGWLYEGGIKVPTIVRWTSHIKAGQVSDIPLSTVDFFPTFEKAMNPSAVLNKTIDGSNILDLMANPSKTKQRTLFWHYPHYSNQGGKPGSAMIKGDYKLILNYEDNSIELYDIKNDVGEKNNLANSKKTMAKRYKKALDKWLKDNHAKFPVTNPIYDASVKKY
ncbi:MAG: sulfatase [Saprospiraceae bacterium]|nr:sulfatase [Saprospiraceae bacterium]